MYAPNFSTKPYYLGNGNIDKIEVYEGSVQTAGYLRAVGQLTYTGDNVTEEEWKLYDTDGSTLIKTITMGYTFDSEDNLTKSEMETT